MSLKLSLLWAGSRCFRIRARGGLIVNCNGCPSRAWSPHPLHRAWAEWHKNQGEFYPHPKQRLNCFAEYPTRILNSPNFFYAWADQSCTREEAVAGAAGGALTSESPQQFYIPSKDSQPESSSLLGTIHNAILFWRENKLALLNFFGSFPDSILQLLMVFLIQLTFTVSCTVPCWKQIVRLFLS